MDEIAKIVHKPLSDGVNRVNHEAERAVNGIGFVILSKDLDRDKYVGKCYRNSTITIITDRNEIIPNCYVSRNVWEYIKFPATDKEKGSMVAWINPPLGNKPIIISVVNKRDELLDVQEENTFNISRKGNKYSSVELQGFGDSGTFNILIDGETELDSNIAIRMLNSMTSALMEVYVQGGIQIEADDFISLKIKKKISFQIIDEEDDTKQANFSYILGEGLKYEDEFKNTIEAGEEGILMKKDNNTIRGVLDMIVDIISHIVVLQGQNPDPVKLKQVSDMIAKLLKK